MLTASGGPFRGRSREDLHDVTPDQALAHPTWSMGPVVTINSATLVNKGLEVIEAHLLFGIPFDRIEVVVHPTSVVHSMVEFYDGSTLAQASPPVDDDPDRARPGLARPGARRRPGGGLDEARDGGSSSPSTTRRSRRSRLAREAGSRGGTAPAVYNAANEVCVAAFLAGEMRFTDIVPTVERVLAAHDVPSDLTDLAVDDVLAADAWAREQARPGRHREGPHCMTALTYPLGVLLFVVGVAVSIGLHELGHLIPGKLFDVKVTQYFVGFGRTLWSRRKGETEYGVKAIPLGGYVKLVGMLPPGPDQDPSLARGSNTGMFAQLIERRALGGVRAGRARRREPALLQAAVVEEASSSWAPA